MQATSHLSRDHAGVPECVEIAPRIGVIVTSTKLGKLQPEGGKLSNVVIELIDASLDSLYTVEFDRILR